MSAIEKRERGRPLRLRQLTSESFYLDDETRGKAGLTPAASSSSRPGKRARQKRLRHLLTIWRGVSSREAIPSLGRPWEASRTILARMTSQYGDVYWRAIDSRC